MDVEDLFLFTIMSIVKIYGHFEGCVNLMYVIALSLELAEIRVFVALDVVNAAFLGKKLVVSTGDVNVRERWVDNHISLYFLSVV